MLKYLIEKCPKATAEDAGSTFLDAQEGHVCNKIYAALQAKMENCQVPE